MVCLYFFSFSQNHTAIVISIPSVEFGPLQNTWWSFHYQWWRHQMEIFSALLAKCAGNSPGTGEFPVQRPVTRSFDVLFDLHLNKRLSKQWCVWWFETPSRPSWRHRYGKPFVGLMMSLTNILTNHSFRWTLRALFQYNDRLSMYGDPRDKDKTVVRPSYLYYGDPYIGMTASSYWDGPNFAYELILACITTSKCQLPENGLIDNKAMLWYATPHFKSHLILFRPKMVDVQ